MKLEQIDQELIHWRERLSLASENLRSFAELPAYQWAVGGTATGRTAERLAPIPGVMNDLCSYRNTLSGVIDRAAQLRDGVSRLIPSSQTLGEITELLEGASIRLAAGPTPPERRELLRPVQTTRAIAPRELLEAMLESFRLLRDRVLEVQAARDEAGARVARLEKQVADLAASSGPGDGPSPDLADAAARISALRQLAESDPLEAASAAQSLEAILGDARQRVGAATAHQAAIRAGLADARQMLEKIVQAQERARQAESERASKVEEEPLPPLTDGNAASSIAAWLGTLEQTALEGKWGPAGIGLSRWRQEAERCLTAEEAVVRSAEAALRRRRDLRGLMDALVAKAHQVRRADEADLSALATEAYELFARRPTPMARAREVVKEYEMRLL